MVERKGVFAIRFGGRPFPEPAIQSLLNLVYLAFLTNFISCLLLTVAGVDVLTSIGAVAACMFNIGPGLGQVGPAEHYGHLPAFAKWVLSGCMLAGRLEFCTLLVLFTPPGVLDAMRRSMAKVFTGGRKLIVTLSAELGSAEIGIHRIHGSMKRIVSGARSPWASFMSFTEAPTAIINDPITR